MNAECLIFSKAVRISSKDGLSWGSACQQAEKQQNPYQNKQANQAEIPVLSYLKQGSLLKN